MKFSKYSKLSFLTLLALGSLAGSCTSNMSGESNDTMIIPLDLSLQRPILEVTINEKGPYSFIFDTGSTVNVIDTDLAVALGLEVVGEDPLGVQGSGNKITSKRVEAPVVSVGGHVVKNVPMSTIALREMVAVDGILSPVFFSDYLVTIDYANSELTVTAGELNNTDKDVVPLLKRSDLSSGAINFEILIDDVFTEAHLDSGNPGSFDLPYSMKDQLHFQEEPVNAGVIHTPAASFNKWSATLVGDIKIGNVIYNNPEIFLVEDFEYANIGYQLLYDSRITIDIKNSLIKFEKNPSTTVLLDDSQQGEEGNEYAGWYGDKSRNVFIEDGEMYLQRQGGPRLKLVEIGADKYEMVFDIPVSNELPLVMFTRDASHEVNGLTFIYSDGREEFVSKDK